MYSTVKPGELQFSRTLLSKAQILFVIVCSNGEKALKINSIVSNYVNLNSKGEIC